MIVCGWCESPTEPGRCSHCGRDPAQPWTQRGQEPPPALDAETPAGRPRLNPNEIRHTLRLAIKENPGATNAELAEYLKISPSTLTRWQKVASSRSLSAAPNR